MPKMTCRNCRGHVAFDDHDLGKIAPCPHCAELITLRVPFELQTWHFVVALSMLSISSMLGYYLWVANQSDDFLQLIRETGKGLAVVGAAAAFYFIPTLIAHELQHRNFLGLSLLNLFLGWTFVGWVIALVWAVLVQERGTPGAPQKVIPQRE